MSALLKPGFSNDANQARFRKSDLRPLKCVQKWVRTNMSELGALWRALSAYMGH